MKSIKHLSPEERKHFIQCGCGEYIDMRNLGEVFKHLHAPSVPEPHWTHSIKVGEPAAYLKNNDRLDLN
jgi:hypothetical protein